MHVKRDLFCLTDMPFGQLPVLRVDGEQYCRSEAIFRFLAREFGKDSGLRRFVSYMTAVVEYRNRVAFA